MTKDFLRRIICLLINRAARAGAVELRREAVSLLNEATRGRPQDFERLRLRANLLGRKIAASGGGGDITKPVMSVFTAVAVSDTEIEIAYAATDDTGVTGYDVQRSASGTGGWTNLLANSSAPSPYSHTGLTAETEYFYRGRARDAAGNVSAWQTASATTEETPDNSLLWDQLSANARNAIPEMFSTRLTKPDYAGAAIRVKNVDTNAQSDLPPNWTRGQQAALGADDKLRVVKWYDQRGGGRDLNFEAEGQNSKVRIAWLGGRPVLDFSFVTGSQYGSSGASGGFAVANPAKFYAVDMRVGSKVLSCYYDLSSSQFRYIDDISSQKVNQNNGVLVSYTRQVSRGMNQLTTAYQTGADSAAINGSALTAESATNAGDTTGASCIHLLGDQGGSALPFTGRLGEIVTVNDSASLDADDAAAIRESQEAYFMGGYDLYMLGDSLAYGANLTDGFGNDKQDDWSVGAQARDILGDDWDCYLLAKSGSAVNHPTDLPSNWLSPGGLADVRIPPVYHPTAAEKVFVIWSGWNDVNSGKSYAQFKSDLIAFVAKLKTDYAGCKVVICSMPVTGVPPSGGLGNYDIIRATFNAEIETDFSTTYGADAAALVHQDEIIGDGADVYDADYWNDTVGGTQPGLHMSKLGYGRAAVYIAAACETAVS